MTAVALTPPPERRSNRRIREESDRRWDAIPAVTKVEPRLTAAGE